ncbi:N,N-dimethylformamidase beta subunit family domain-containing protein [Cypionkella sp. TWP1-2-1b2]|uniref:N,N-dimethylformamidase beta subunit family domain-containing protein n=1 Tax=Cypionkella sp. TWP1-2-1b2 TaxID=2804675 RepID=UPI003CEA2A9E
MLKGFFTAGPTDDGDAVTGHYYETASDDRARPQVWIYSSALSYSPGEILILHAMSSASEAQLTIAREGLNPESVLKTTLKISFATTPFDASENGCHWPKALRLTIPDDWQSGVYTLTVTIPGHSSQGLFVLKPLMPSAKTLMLLATGTWCAYNDWGGSNHYQGLTSPAKGDFAPHVSTQRPWAKGFVAWPNDAPRIPHASPLLTKPRYPHMDYARAKGISKKYASSGWAAFERPFAHWCEAQNIALDYTTQHDLQRDPAALNGYDRVLIVGHDEYWAWEMRDHLDAWLDQGGRLARFAGNFFWQIRLSDDLTTQTCFKTTAETADPLAQTNRLTSYWDHPAINRPATSSMGLTGSAGVYAGWSRCAAHGSGGFAIYRPEHWALKGSGLGYGDVLGAASKIFGYEVDGIDYTMTHGLPFAAENAGLQGALTIVGLSPATTLSHATGPQDRDLFIGTGDAEDLALRLYGGLTPENLARASRGNGCMAEYRRGSGAVFNAASCEWVAGLIARERPVEQVTRNILLGDWA